MSVDAGVVIDRLRAAGCVFAEEEAALLLESTDSDNELERRIRERVSGVPLEHVLGWALFCGLRVPVEPGVFVPRPRTEHLVALAAELVTETSVLLDLCCGSGAVSLALASRVPGLRVVASDIDARAVRNARSTLAGGVGTVYEGDLYAPLPEELFGRVDLITIIAPYVPTAQIELLPREARQFEAQVALDGGDDGLVVLGRAIDEASGWLASGGHFVTEVADHQADAVVARMHTAGLTAAVTTDDELGVTIVVGSR